MLVSVVPSDATVKQINVYLRKFSIVAKSTLRSLLQKALKV